MMNNTPRAAPRVLVVDDIPDTLKLLKSWLEMQGYQTIGASSGQEALKLAAEHQPDVILLDVMMPQMDGIETCRRLKIQPQTVSIPVILVTAKDPADARADGMIAGAVDYITKPVNFQDLHTRVEAVLASQDRNPADVQRLLQEVAHTAMTMLDSALVWLLALDKEHNLLFSETLITNSGSQEEAAFLKTAANERDIPQYTLEDSANPLVQTLITRQTAINFPVRRLSESPTTLPLYRAVEQLHVQYLTVVPLIAAGRTVGVMVLGYYQPHDMETPRAHQILSAFGSQAATALDYARLIADLHHREEEAQQERAFRQMILDTMSDGLVVIDAQGHIKFTNRRLLRMTGYSQDYLEGRIVGELFHPEDRVEVMRGLLSEHATTMKFDQRLVTESGKVMPVLIARSRTPSNGLDNQVIVLSDMTEQKQREQELERQTGHLQALYQAAQAMTSNLSVQESLQHILNSATDVVEAQGASLFLVNVETDDELIVVAAVGHRANEFIGLRVPLGEGLAGWVAREAQSQLIINPDQDSRFYRAVDEQTGLSTRSLIAVPLVHGDQVIGVIEVVNKLNEGVFDENDVRLLESMAGTAAVSIVNARLYDQAQRRVTELATLLDASEAASSTLDLATILEHIVRSLTTNLDVAQAMVVSWNSAKKQLLPLAEISNTHWVDYLPRDLETGSAAYKALTAAQPQMAVSRDRELSSADRYNLDSLGMSRLLAIPMQREHTPEGLATLYSLTPQAFTARDVIAAEATIRKWLDNLPADMPLRRAGSQHLTALLDQLLGQPGVAWVNIQTCTPGENKTQPLQEKGFVEWTRRTGPSFSVVPYPTFQAVITSRTMHRISLSALEPESAEYQWLVSRGGGAALLVPLTLHGISIGMVILIDVDERIFDQEEMRLAQGIANVVSNAMENARLYQSLQSRAKALESAYSELQDADRAKDQFIQNISHELRTPLIHVLGYAELLADGMFGSMNDEQRDALRNIAEKGQKVADILEDMVAAHGHESHSTQQEPLDLIALVQRIIEAQQEQITASGLKILTHFPPLIPPVMANADAIGEAFLKLLDNALKFGRDGEQIEIVIHDTEGPVVQVALRDYGIGISPSEQSKIFQRFYQVDGSATRRYGGTGLGLAVAKAIIESHGGKIGVKSRPGEGSIFFFNLPKVNLQHKTSIDRVVEQD